MASRPTGTLTFLFTDLEGSTQLWERDAAAMRSALTRHDQLLRNSVARHGGHVFKTGGDAFCAVFGRAPDALAAALDAQLALSSEPWPGPAPSTRERPTSGTATTSGPPSTARHGCSPSPTGGRRCCPRRFTTSCTTSCCQMWRCAIWDRTA